MNESAFWVGLCSVFLYFSMALSSGAQFKRFLSGIEKTKNVRCKQLFFASLCLSCIFEMPYWIYCISSQAPDSCVTEDSSFPSKIIILIFQTHV